MSAPKLSVVPNYAAIVLPDIDSLLPGGWGLVSSLHHPDSSQRFRVTGARVAAMLPQSRLLHLAQRIPGVRQLLRPYTDAWRKLASMQLRIDHVAVGYFACAPDKCAELPVVTAGSEISVRVTNTGARPLVARVIVEGVLT